MNNEIFWNVVNSIMLIFMMCYLFVVSIKFIITNMYKKLVRKEENSLFELELLYHFSLILIVILISYISIIIFK